MSDVRPLAYDSALYVALNLRPEDSAEIYALRSDDNPILLAADVMAATARSGLGWSLHHRGRPAALIGAIEAWPGRWEAFAFGTEDQPRVALGLTRLARRTLAPALLARGAERAQAASRSGHHAAHRWLERLGARREAVLKNYGRDGVDYALYVWLSQ